MESNDQNGRVVKLFKNGRKQAIRIPRELELPGDTAILRREGNRLVIEPMERPSLRALLASWEPLTEGLPPFEDLPAEPVDL
jgi:antitoxin VapB